MATTFSSSPVSTPKASSRQAHLTIKDAFTRLQQCISQDDAQQFQKTTLSDVRQAAVEVEEKMAAKQSMRNMRRFETFLNGIDQYSKVLEVLCNGTPYLPWIWAPIKLMVQISSEYLSSFEKLMDAYTQIAETFPRFDRLRTTFKDDTGFQELIALFYADILEFHRRAYKFFRARVWKRVFDSSWGRFDSRFKRILSNLAQHADLIDKEANAIDIAEAKALREKLDDDLSRREKESAMTQRSSIISWLDLSGIPKQEDELDRLLSYCQSGSCDWLLKNDKVERWVSDHQSQQFVWIHGKPGAGKSVLCSSLISQLQQKQIPVLYFFCTYRSPNSRKAVDVLKSLAAQAIPMNPDIVPFLVDTYVSKSLTSSMRDLRTLLSCMLSAMAPGRIILDGLDECEIKEQENILEEISTITRSANAGWKALLSSQEIPNISRSFSKLAHKAKVSLSEENRSISAAIETFIDQRIATLNKDSPYLWRQGDLAQSLKREMSEKANGMFLWVRLVLTSMEEIYSLKQLQEVVLTLPSDLTELYDRIVDGIKHRLKDHNLFDQALSVLRFVLHSYRPLKRMELLDVVVLRDDVMDDSTKLPVEALNMCKPLIEIEAGDTVVLIHFSLQQYLLNRSDMSSRKAHRDTALACTKVLTSGLSLVDPDQSQNGRLLDTGKGFFSLLPYAHTFWLEHLLSFAALGGGLSEETSWDLVLQLQTFLARHEDFARLMSMNTTPVLPKWHLATSRALPDDRLHFLDDGLEFYPFAAKVIEYRKSLGDQSPDSGDQSQNHCAQVDPTLMTRMIHELEKVTQALISAISVPGLPQDLLDAFKTSHGGSGFLCRYQNCAAVSGTFLTESARNEHENLSHVKRIPCQDVLCPFSTIGFRTLRDLKSHTQNFHSRTRPSIVPSTVRRPNPGVQSSLPSFRQASGPRDNGFNRRAAHSHISLVGPPQSVQSSSEIIWHDPPQDHRPEIPPSHPFRAEQEAKKGLLEPEFHHQEPPRRSSPNPAVRALDNPLRNNASPVPESLTHRAVTDSQSHPASGVRIRRKADPESFEQMPFVSGSQLDAGHEDYQVPWASNIDGRSRCLPEIITYGPSKALHGTMLNVYIRAAYDLTAQRSFFSIMFGRKRCDATWLDRGHSNGLFYEVMTEIPPFDATGCTDSQMTLLLNVEDEYGQNLGVVEVGDFTYADGSSHQPYSLSSPQDIHEEGRFAGASGLEAIPKVQSHQAKGSRQSIDDSLYPNQRPEYSSGREQETTRHELDSRLASWAHEHVRLGLPLTDAMIRESEQRLAKQVGIPESELKTRNDVWLSKFLLDNALMDPETIWRNNPIDGGLRAQFRFECSSMTIGTWHIVRQSAMDLIVFYSPEECCLTYYLTEKNSRRHKIVYPFSYIESISLELDDSPRVGPITRRAGWLVVKLTQPPNFMWISSSVSSRRISDPTPDYQASWVLVHHIHGDPNVLSRQLQKLFSLESYQNRHKIRNINAFAMPAPVPPINQRVASQPNPFVSPDEMPVRDALEPASHGDPMQQCSGRQQQREITASEDFLQMRQQLGTDHDSLSIVSTDFTEPQREDPWVFSPKDPGAPRPWSPDYGPDAD